MNALLYKLIKNLAVATIYTKGRFMDDRDSMKKQNKEYLLEGNIFVLASGPQRLSNI